MPILNLVTNVKIADAKAFALEISKLAAETLGRQEKYISVSIIYNETLTVAGTFDPAITLRIDSLDNFINREANDKYCKAFFNFFETKLGVPGDRGFIIFIDHGKENMGYMGNTVATFHGE